MLTPGSTDGWQRSPSLALFRPSDASFSLKGSDSFQRSFFQPEPTQLSDFMLVLN